MELEHTQKIIKCNELMLGKVS